MYSFLREHLYQSMLLLISIVAFVTIVFWQSNMQTAVLQIGEKKVYVQIAKTLKQQDKGLGGRDTLAPYGGMVFPTVPAKKTGIVMRDMQFPIDIIWSLDGTIVDIAPNVQPEPNTTESELFVYFPRKKANLVIEVESGFVERYSIKIGDAVDLIDG